MNVGKDQQTNYLKKIIALIYNYMDYWIPCIVVCSFPLWLFPYLLFIAASKTYSLWSYIFKTVFAIVTPISSPPLYYAILKGNGRYLRDNPEQVLIQQLYDYTARRFMSIGQLEPQTRIVELECQSDIGLNFLGENNKSGSIVGLQSNLDIFKNIDNPLGLILHSDYSLNNSLNKFDCLLLFNFKSKMCSNKNQQKIDLVKILNFCQCSMQEGGYLIYGDYFQPGQTKTFIQLFTALNFKISEHQDITKNIDYARKLMKKKCRSWEQKYLDAILKQFMKLFGRKGYNEGRNFIVFILQKVQNANNQE